MAEKDVKGVDINATGNKSWIMNYRLSDVQAVFRRVKPNNWGQIVKWLEENGDNSNELTPGEAVSMKEDFQKLEKSGKPFTSDPDKAFELAHQNR